MSTRLIAISADTVHFLEVSTQQGQVRLDFVGSFVDNCRLIHQLTFKRDNYFLIGSK